MKINWTELEDFFLSARLKILADDVKPQKVPGLPGCYKITHSQDGLVLAEIVWKGEEDTGLIVITADGQPVWNMHFGNKYSGEERAFRKEILLETYEQKRFLGGHGPAEYENGKFYYRNRMEKKEFINFCGKEDVAKNEVWGGWSWYKGGKHETDV